MITRIAEKPGSRRATDDKDGREYEYVLTIVTNSINDDENTIYNHPGIPRRGNPYINNTVIDAGAACIGLDLDRVDKLVWEVACRYSSKAGEKSKKNPKDPDKPLQWPTEIHWSGKEIEVYSTVDEDGNPFNNSAGDLLKDIPPLYRNHGLVTLSRYEATYDPFDMGAYAGRVNSVPFLGQAKDTVKAAWPEAVLTYFESIDRYFWKVTYSFEITPRNKPWTPLEIADRGTAAFVYATGTWVKTAIRDELGNIMSDGDFLDGTGRRLGTVGWPPKPDTPKMCKFRGYREADLNRLNLP